MISYESAKSIASKNNLDRVMAASYKLLDGYLFLLIPKGMPSEDFFLGGYLKVTLNGRLEEYSPVFDPEEFKQALKNRIE